LIFIYILAQRDANLMQIAHASYTKSGGFRSRQTWQEHRGQNRDDGDNDEKLYQREGAHLRRAVQEANAACGEVPSHG